MKKVYSAVFPIDSNSSIEGIEKTIKLWISESEYNPIDYDELEGLLSDNYMLRKETKHGMYEINSVVYKMSNEIFYGMLYKIIKEGNDIITEMIVKEKEADEPKYVAVRVYEQVSVVGNGLKYVKKPKIVTKLIEENGGDFDENMLVKHTPHIPQSDDVVFISDILYHHRTKLPIIYLSRDENNELQVEAHALARVMAGMAHVIVEPDKKFSYVLREYMDGKNAYNGAIGIYFPNGRIQILLPERYGIERMPVINTIYNQVRSAMLNYNSEVLKDIDFTRIKRMKDKQKFEEMTRKINEKHESERTNKELQELLNMAFEELSAKENELREAYDKIKKQNIELSNLKALYETTISTSDLRNSGNFVIPSLIELYPGEIKHLINTALEEYKKHRSPANMNNTRVEEIVNKLIESNPVEVDFKEIHSKIKKALSSDSIDEMRRLLARVGIIVEKTEGGHYKLMIPGYKAYSTIASTIGDKRRGRNNAFTNLKWKLLIMD